MVPQKLQSPKIIRHSHKNDNVIAVKPDMVWYESYITIEAIPEGMVVDRDAEKVKHEFEHILSNIYVHKQKPKKQTVLLKCTFHL